MKHADDPRIGSLVEQWRLVERLGEGPDWSTYRARRFAEDAEIATTTPKPCATR